MLTRVNHIAIAVPDLAAAANLYKSLGARVSEPCDLPEHGVTVVFIALENTKIELLHPLGPDSPISAFLERRPAGGLHHLCFEVDNLEDAADKVKKAGARLLGAGSAKIGAHGKPVLFAHPNDFQGTLVEFEQT